MSLLNVYLLAHMLVLILWCLCLITIVGCELCYRLWCSILYCDSSVSAGDGMVSVVAVLLLGVILVLVVLVVACLL